MKCLGQKHPSLNCEDPNYPGFLCIFPMLCLYVFCVILRVSSSKQLFCVVEMQCVFFEVGPECLKQLVASLILERPRFNLGPVFVRFMVIKWQ